MFPFAKCAYAAALTVAVAFQAVAGDKAPPQAPPASDDVMDLQGAVPLDQISKLPSTAEQAKAIQDRIDAERPAVENAKVSSDKLAQETAQLQKKLVVAARAVEALEAENIRLDAAIGELSRQNARLTAAFSRDRGPATRLAAMLERLQSGMPPAMAMKSDDVLAAARGTMILGASLPQIYGRAAALARRIEHLKTVRSALMARRAEAGRNAQQLTAARVAMDRLLARKRVQAASAAFVYGDLKKKLDEASADAANLDVLLKRIAVLREKPSMQGVGAVDSVAVAGPSPTGLLNPVAGTAVRGGPDGVGGSAAPGITYVSIAGAQVLAPVEGKVRFAGAYPKNGFVLILETASGYDVVLTGLGRLDVRLGDRLLAGEPVGALPDGGGRPPRLYFELRHAGQGMNPAPYIEAGSRKAKRT